MSTKVTISAAALMAAGAMLLTTQTIADSPESCDPDLSTSSECWHDCETENEITICEILMCPEGINCGFDRAGESDPLRVLIQNPPNNGPRLGDHIVKHAKGGQARGRVSTQVYQSVGVDSLSDTELVILVTPFLTAAGGTGSE